jgi:hypothetical protein
MLAQYRPNPSMGISFKLLLLLLLLLLLSYNKCVIVPFVFT